MIQLKSILNEDLRKWFGKGPTGGWDRYNTKGEKVGKCGDAEKGDAYVACLSNEKAKKLGKDGIASFVKRKRAAQSKAGDSKKGGEQSKGQKPTFVKTGASENVNEEKVYIDYLNKAKGFKQDRIKFNSYEDAIKWARTNFDKFSPDMIKYENVNEEWSQKYKDSINCSNPKGFSQKAHCAGKRKNENMASKLTVEQKMKLFLEKNTPTDPEKWSYAKSQAKKKFDVYPSAYANGWAAKKYKELGGGWKKSE
jgi:hypothetical protein